MTMQTVDHRSARRGGPAGQVRSLAADNRPQDILTLIGAVDPANVKLVEWMFRIAIKALPDEFLLIEAACRLTEARGEVTKAGKRWNMARRRHLQRIEGHLGLINFLIRHCEYGVAERMVQAARNVLGVRAPLLECEARLAEHKADWAAAVGHWRRLEREHAADYPEAAARRVAAEMEAKAAAETPRADIVPPPPEPSTEEEREAAKRLLGHFESLGENCEFGLLHRQFGGEPLGLMRFSKTSPGALLKFLSSRFADLGAPEHLRLVLKNGQYGIHHTESSWTKHTGIKPAEDLDLDKVLADQIKYTVFLRNRLVKQLDGASKIFVYQKSALDYGTIDALYEALQSYAPNILMCVRLHNRDYPSGSVQWRNERLMIAAIDRRGLRPQAKGWDISAGYWLHFCSLALERWQQLRPAAAASVEEVLGEREIVDRAAIMSAMAH